MSTDYIFTCPGLPGGDKNGIDSRTCFESCRNERDPPLPAFLFPCRTVVMKLSDTGYAGIKLLDVILILLAEIKLHLHA